MLSKILDENSILVIPEESDDLLILRRIIKQGDKIIGNTTRVIKQDKDYSRPDRGERIQVRIALGVERISLDNVLDRLRVGGTIVESNNESIPHGTHHSFIIKMNEEFKIIKKKWTEFEKKLISSKAQSAGFILVALDTSECGIGRLKGTHLQLLPNIYSNAGGKRYKTSFNIEKFFDAIHIALSSIIKENDLVIIFGPGETKKKIGNYFVKTKLAQNHKFQIVEVIDSGGEDGIYTFTKSPVMKKIMSDSKLAKVSAIIDEIMVLANKKSRKFTMGFDETEKANRFGAIESLVFSDKIIQVQDEQKIIEFLNDVETKGAKMYSVDSTTDLGLRVTGLGGIVSLLRFPVAG
jgi:protein pelota